MKTKTEIPPSLKELATLAVIKHHTVYTDEQMSLVNCDSREFFLGKVRMHKSLERFMRIFNVSNVEEMHRHLTRIRWDASYEIENVKNYHYRGFRRGIVHSICLIPRGVATGSFNGRVSVFQEEKETVLHVGKKDVGISCMHYWKGRLFAVYCNWMVRVWEYDTNTKTWVSAIEIVDHSRSTRWVKTVMCKGRYLLDVGSMNVQLYEVAKNFSTTMVWASPFQMGLAIADAALSENHIVLVMETMIFGEPGVPTGNLVLIRMDTLRVSINIPLIGHQTCPIKVVINETPNGKSGWIYVGYKSGLIEQYAYAYVLEGGCGSKDILSVLPSVRKWCASDGETLKTISCNGTLLTALFMNQEHEVVTRVYSMASSAFVHVREFSLKDFYSDPPSTKKRRTQTHFTKSNDVSGMDMDEGRLVCYDNKAQRIHYWNFSE